MLFLSLISASRLLIHGYAELLLLMHDGRSMIPVSINDGNPIFLLDSLKLGPECFIFSSFVLSLINFSHIHLFMVNLEVLLFYCS